MLKNLHSDTVRKQHWTVQLVETSRPFQHYYHLCLKTRVQSRDWYQWGALSTTGHTSDRMHNLQGGSKITEPVTTTYTWFNTR